MRRFTGSRLSFVYGLTSRTGICPASGRGHDGFRRILAQQFCQPRRRNVIPNAACSQRGSRSNVRIVTGEMRFHGCTIPLPRIFRFEDGDQNIR